MNQSYRNLRTDGTLFSWNTYSSKMVSGINCLFHFVIITSNTSCCDLFCLKGTSTIANFKYMWIQGHTVHVPYCSFPVLKWDGGIRFRLCTFSDPARNAVSLSLKLATDERNLAGSAGTSWICSIYGQAGFTEVSLSIDFSTTSLLAFFYFGTITAGSYSHQQLIVSQW